MRFDDIGTLKQARNCLKEEFSVDYTLGGVSALFQRMKVKLKTGRPGNVKQDREQMEEFAKKISALSAPLPGAHLLGR